MDLFTLSWERILVLPKTIYFLNVVRFEECFVKTKFPSIIDLQKLSPPHPRTVSLSVKAHVWPKSVQIIRMQLFISLNMTWQNMAAVWRGPRRTARLPHQPKLSFLDIITTSEAEQSLEKDRKSDIMKWALLWVSYQYWQVFPVNYNAKPLSRLPWTGEGETVQRQKCRSYSHVTSSICWHIRWADCSASTWFTFSTFRSVRQGAASDPPCPQNAPKLPSITSTPVSALGAVGEGVCGVDRYHSER